MTVVIRKKKRLVLVLVAMLVLGGGARSQSSVGDVVCLRCHDNSNPKVDKSAYLLTGHKNVLRQVTAGVELFGPGGAAYSSAFDWANAQYNGADLYYLINGWLSGTRPEVVITNGSYPCSRCHTTGWVDHRDPAADATAGLEPWVSRGIAAEVQAIFNLNPSGTPNYPSWAFDGVQCERCHGEATTGATVIHYDGGGYTPALPYRAEATALCVECHTQDHPEYFIAGSLPEIRVGNGYGYAARLDDYADNVAFLNSPHARFTGSAALINDGSQYDSTFAEPLCLSPSGVKQQATTQEECEAIPGTWDSIEINRGCVGCHDVHQSTVAATNATDSIVMQCGIQCHAPETEVDPGNPDPEAVPDWDGYAGFHDNMGNWAPSTISPAGVTPTNPLGRGTNPASCITCHMGKDTTHLWAIELDPDYRTLPTETEYNSGQQTARRNNNGQVAMDVDLVCQQCHGGNGPAATTLTRAEAANYAVDYHNTGMIRDITINPVNAYGARFNWYKGSGCNSIAVFGDLNNSTCLWSAPESTTIDDPNSCATEIIFPTAGAYRVTLTTGLGARSMVVTASGNNLIPSAANTVTIDSNDTGDATGMTAKLTDASTSNACGGSGGLGTVLWGDGTVTPAVAHLGTATHEYTIAGIYVISYAFRDAVNNKKAYAGPILVEVPDKVSALFDITGYITRWVDANSNEVVDDGETSGFNNVEVLLKQSGEVVNQSRSTGDGGLTIDDGFYAFYNVVPRVDDAPYVIEPVKQGYSFSPATLPASRGAANGGHSAMDFTAFFNLP